MLAQMKVYFHFCMPNDAYEYMKMLLNVNKNAKIDIECELHANVRIGAHECIFALLVVNSHK